MRFRDYNRFETVDGVEIEIGNKVYEGSVDCEFSMEDYAPAYLGGAPENCYPEECGECEIDVLNWYFCDEDGEEVDVEKDVVEEAIDKLDQGGHLDSYWERIMED